MQTRIRPLQILTYLFSITMVCGHVVCEWVRGRRGGEGRGNTALAAESNIWVQVFQASLLIGGFAGFQVQKLCIGAKFFAPRKPRRAS